jgi:hypothetical protein
MDCARICGAKSPRIYRWVGSGKLREYFPAGGRSGQTYVRLGDVREMLRTAPRKPIAC